MKKLWNKDFILLLQGNAVSTLGDLMYSVAIGYWVYEQTGSTTLMGIMSAISMFVTMFCSPFSGSIVDKCNRKWVMVGMDLMQSLVMLIIGALAYAGKLSVAGVLIAAFLAAAGSVFYSPAVSTLMLDIIPHDDMVRGQSIFSSVNSLINMLGSAFSGVMVAFFGVPLIVVINGLSNLYSAITELFIHVPKTVHQGEEVTVKSILRDSKLAIRSIAAEPCLRVFIPFALILNILSSGPLTMALPFTMEKGFSVDQYGYLMFVYTAASLICAVLLGVIKLNSKMRYWTMVVGFIGSIVFLIGAYLSTSFIGVCAMMGIGAFLNVAGNTIFNASLMLAMPEENRGAIMGFISSACTGGMAVSTLVYGILGDIFPLYILFSIGSAIALLPMIYMCGHPRIRTFILTY